MPTMSHPVTYSHPRSLAHHGQSILTLGLPLVANNLATMGMGFTDTVMAGQLGGHALAAVAIGNTLWYTAQLGGMGVLMAVSPMVAHALGANQPEKVTGLVKQSFWIALMLGVLGLFLLNLAGPFSWRWVWIPMWCPLRPATCPPSPGACPQYSAIFVFDICPKAWAIPGP
jgi:Na+-driven multidrug efflux pump